MLLSKFVSKISRKCSLLNNSSLSDEFAREARQSLFKQYFTKKWRKLTNMFSFAVILNVWSTKAFGFTNNLYRKYRYIGYRNRKHSRIRLSNLLNHTVYVLSMQWRLAVRRFHTLPIVYSVNSNKFLVLYAIKNYFSSKVPSFQCRSKTLIIIFSSISITLIWQAKSVRGWHLRDIVFTNLENLK